MVILEFFEKSTDFLTVKEKFGVEFEDENGVCMFSDYANLYNLEGHRQSKSPDELLSLRLERWYI